MIRKNRVYEKWPSDLADAVRRLNDHPTSVRLANELYEVGMPLIKQNGLYIPLFPYRAELGYIPIDNSGAAILNFERRWNAFGNDKMQAAILTPEENTGVEVVRQTGARRYRNWKANPLSVFWYENMLDYLNATLRKSPSKAGTFKIGQGGKLEGFVGYDLLLEDPPITKEY